MNFVALFFVAEMDNLLVTNADYKYLKRIFGNKKYKANENFNKHPSKCFQTVNGIWFDLSTILTILSTIIAIFCVPIWNFICH